MPRPVIIDSPSSSDYSDTESPVQIPSPPAFFDGTTDNVPTAPPGPRVRQEEIGRSCEAKNLYQGKKTCKCCINWVYDRPKTEAKPPPEPADSKRYAVLVRHRRNHKDDRGFSLHSIVIQSPPLKKLLCEVFRGYVGVTADLEDVVFKPPFLPFFHRWTEFGEAIENTQDPETASHALLLHDVLTGEMAETVRKQKDLVSHGVITFDYLWTLFIPGQLLYAYVDGHDRMFKLSSSDYQRSTFGEPEYNVTTYFVEDNGTCTGYAPRSFTLRSFFGTTNISSLRIFPADFHPAIDKIKEGLYKRGKLYEAYRGFHHKAYRGFIDFDSTPGIPGHGIPPPPGALPPALGTAANREVPIDNRIVIDAATYYQHNPIAMPFVTPLETFSVFTPRLEFTTAEQHKHIAEQHMPIPEHHRPIPGGKGKRRSRGPPGMPPPPRMVPPPPPGGIILPPPPPMDNFGFPPFPNPGGQSDEGSGDDKPKNLFGLEKDLTYEQLLLCTPLIRGFCLKNKRWGQFIVDNVRDIKWNEQAFGNLVIPPDYKQLVQAFVESQMAQGQLKFDDIVDGKGRGLVMLLSGEPGVGKTLTAETLAEHLKAPLYMISAAELGETTQEVEAMLERVLNLATKWKAILLLDECDVFLEQRRDSDLVRNKIVSIFLRTLEYYHGIIILTTNRISSFDVAFKSRIHITLHYPRLDASAREHIWRNFHKLSRYESALVDADFHRLAEEEMNGREIKNAMKAAQLLATSRREAIGLGHVQSVLRATMGKSMPVAPRIVGRSGW